MIELKNLREIAAGDEDFVIGVLALFVSKENEYASTLRHAIQYGDLEELRQIVHKIKSSVSVIGMHDFRLKLDALEKRLTNRELSVEQANREGKAILEEFFKAEDEVRELLSQLKTNA